MNCNIAITGFKVGSGSDNDSLQYTVLKRICHFWAKLLLIFMLAPSSALLILVEARAENEDVRAEGWLSHLRSVKFSNDGHRLKMSLDETKWASIGVGLKFSGNWTENIDNNRYKDTFTVDFVRVFISGQVHKYVKFGVNAECTFCNNQSSGDIPKMAFRVLDAAAHFEINRYFNVWGGRMLVPTDRNEMSGPFYMATLDGFKTPFFSADYSLKHGVGGAGFYGRDDGGTFFGSVEPKFIPGTLQYTVGIFRGLRSSRKSNFGPNQNDHALYAWRVTYNFLNPEENPGYYTSDLYYGEAGDILALAFGGSYQKDGAGSAAHKSDFIGLVFDVLFEKVLPQNMGVFTAKGEYKRFFSDYNKAAFSDPDCFCIFDGQSWTATALYLFPTKVGIGRFQPYGRYTSIQPRGSSNREEIEGGVNYIIDTFSLRVGAFYQYGDLTTKGIENYAPGAMGPKIGVFKLAFQYQM